MNDDNRDQQGLGMTTGRIRWGTLTIDDTRENMNLEAYDGQPFVLVVGPADMEPDEVMAAVSIEMIADDGFPSGDTDSLRGREPLAVE